MQTQCPGKNFIDNFILRLSFLLVIKAYSYEIQVEMNFTPYVFYKG